MTVRVNLYHQFKADGTPDKVYVSCYGKCKHLYIDERGILFFTHMKPNGTEEHLTSGGLAFKIINY